MDRERLILNIAEDLDETIGNVTKLYESFFDKLTETFRNGDSYTQKGFGSFEVEKKVIGKSTHKEIIFQAAAELEQEVRE